jgi:hypothetical protein
VAAGLCNKHWSHVIEKVVPLTYKNTVNNRKIGGSSDVYNNTIIIRRFRAFG